MIPQPVVDYRKFRLSRLNTPEFSHLKLLLYWAVFGILFLLVERGGVTGNFTPIHCPLDDKIPFCEWFLIPYLFWFVFLAGMLLYGLLWDVKAFRRMMYFIMVTYTVTIVIYFVFPTCQELRPAAFPRDNLLTRFIGWFYTFDTNTNVCPSIHVIGSVAVAAAAWNSRKFSTTPWRIAFAGTAALISISTVFMKQHSILDVAAALPVCVLGWWASARLLQRWKRRVKNWDFA